MKRAITIAIMAVSVFFPGILWAGDPAPFPDFTFKRIKVPPSGSGGLIDVQIDPNAQVARISVAKPALKDAPPDSPEPSTSTDAWFWEAISPKLENASAGRLEQAVTHIRNEGAKNGLATPRLQTMQTLATRFGRDILVATIGTEVSPALVLAVMGVESAGRIDAVSSAGAEGLMQLIPATAERFGVTDTKDPAQNIKGGVAYLNWLMEEFSGDPLFVLAAYNAGENAVKSRGGVPDFPETRAYVPRVLAAWTVARGLCLTPPELASDGCVFANQEANN